MNEGMILEIVQILYGILIFLGILVLLSVQQTVNSHVTRTNILKVKEILDSIVNSQYIESEDIANPLNTASNTPAFITLGKGAKADQIGLHNKLTENPSNSLWEEDSLEAEEQELL